MRQVVLIFSWVQVLSFDVQSFLQVPFQQPFIAGFAIFNLKQQQNREKQPRLAAVA